VAVVGVLVGTALLSGCAEKQEARDTLPTGSAAPTTEALTQLGPADFPVPDEARSKDEAGAEAFARYYVDLINHQQAIPAGQPLRDLGPDCQVCLRTAQRFDETAEAGQHYEGGQLSIVGEPGVTLRGDTVNFAFIGQLQGGGTYDSSGALVPGTEFATQERVPSAIELVWSPVDEGWLVSGAFFG
jgi:hypothetical protein